MRLSQAEFAEAVRAAGNAMGAPNQCTKRLVQKWEAGEHSICRPEYLKVLRTLTGLTARELGFHLPPDADPDQAGPGDGADPAPGGSAPGSSSGSGSAPGSNSGPGTGPGSNSSPRPGSGSAFGASAIAAMRAAGATGGPESEPAAHPGPAAALDPEAVLGDSMTRLRYALEHPSAVDSRTADFVDTATALMFDLEHHSPARLIAPTVDRHLATVTGLLTAARHETVRRRLTAAAGHTAALAGWIAFDRGDVTSANRFWELAISAAETTLDTSLLACSLTFLSYSAARRGDPGTAWQLAHSASWHASADPRACAWATARAGLHAAQVGARVDAERAVEVSLELASRLPNPQPTDPTAPWVRVFDQARLLAATAQTLAMLGDRRSHEFATDAITALGPPQVKSRAIVLAEATMATALAGRYELSLDYGSAAIVVARELESSVALDVLQAVTPILVPHAAVRPVRELLPQLTRLSRISDRLGKRSLGGFDW